MDWERRQWIDVYDQYSRIFSISERNEHLGIRIVGCDDKELLIYCLVCDAG